MNRPNSFYPQHCPEILLSAYPHRKRMQGPDAFAIKHLRRQSNWSREMYLWLLDTKVLVKNKKRLKALDVGCGPGYVMEAFRDRMDVRGVDIDLDMVAMCEANGLKAQKADARALPFPDATFDIVYCSMLLLWTKEPSKALGEMSRISRKWVICLAEPDFGARIDFPETLAELNGLLVEGIKADGGDPFIGRKLRALFRDCGMDAEMGVHPGIWGIDRLREETEDEWRWVEMMTPKADKKRLRELKNARDRALKAGTQFQFNPVFWAMGKK